MVDTEGIGVDRVVRPPRRSGVEIRRSAVFASGFEMDRSIHTSRLRSQRPDVCRCRRRGQRSVPLHAYPHRFPNLLMTSATRAPGRQFAHAQETAAHRYTIGRCIRRGSARRADDRAEEGGTRSSLRRSPIRAYHASCTPAIHNKPDAPRTSSPRPAARVHGHALDWAKHLQLGARTARWRARDGTGVTPRQHPSRPVFARTRPALASLRTR